MSSGRSDTHAGPVRRLRRRVRRWRRHTPVRELVATAIGVGAVVVVVVVGVLFVLLHQA